MDNLLRLQLYPQIKTLKVNFDLRSEAIETARYRDMQLPLFADQ
jgi:hypothetical protein